MTFGLQPLGYRLGERVLEPAVDLADAISPQRFLRTGFERVHWTSETPVNLAVQIFDSKWRSDLVKVIDGAVFVTSSQGGLSPGPGKKFAESLNLKQSIPIFDINDACTGFITGLKLASALVKTGHKNVLLVTADAYSLFQGVRDTSLGGLFSDAASAVLISRSPDAQLETGFPYYSIGQEFFHFSHQLDLAEALTTRPFSMDSGHGITGQMSLSMNGAQVFSFVLAHLPKHISYLEKNAGLSPPELAWLVHQGSRKVVEEVKASLGVEQNLFNARLIGNVVSSSIPLQLMRDVDVMGSKEWLGMLAFGVGLSFASSFLRVVGVAD